MSKTKLSHLRKKVFAPAIAFSFLALLFVGSYQACSSSNGGTTATAPVTPPTASSILSISPTSATLSMSTTTQFSASGGTPPYTYSVQSGIGTIDPNSGLYTAPSATGTAVVQVLDQNRSTASAMISVTTASSGGSTSGLGLSPTSTSVQVNGVVTFSISGGTGPYTLSISTGVGAVNSTQATYQAPSTPGSATVVVTDTTGLTASCFIIVNATNAVGPLTINPNNPTVPTGGSINFVVAGGTPPYSYQITTGPGILTGTVFQAPNADATTVFSVTDSAATTVTTNITTSSTISAQVTVVYRSFNNLNSDHLYSTDPTEGAAQNYASDTSTFKVFSQAFSGTHLIYRCFSGTYHFVSSDSTCGGKTSEGPFGSVYDSQQNNSLTLYSYTKGIDHLVTTNPNEGPNAGFTFQGILGFVPQ